MSSADDPALVSAVAAEIRAHLDTSPSAGDTALGVWQWWLGSTRDRVDVTTVERALEQLVERGVMGSRDLASGQRFYFGFGGHGDRP